MNDESHNRYYCPMKCEREKTYPDPGRCPVCNMHLQKIVPTESTEERAEHIPH